MLQPVTVPIRPPVLPRVRETDEFDVLRRPILPRRRREDTTDLETELAGLSKPSRLSKILSLASVGAALAGAAFDAPVLAAVGSGLGQGVASTEADRTTRAKAIREALRTAGQFNASQAEAERFDEYNVARGEFEAQRAAEREAAAAQRKLRGELLKTATEEQYRRQREEAIKRLEHELENDPTSERVQLELEGLRALNAQRRAGAGASAASAEASRARAALYGRTDPNRVRSSSQRLTPTQQLDALTPGELQSEAADLSAEIQILEQQIGEVSQGRGALANATAVSRLQGDLAEKRARLALIERRTSPAPADTTGLSGLSDDELLRLLNGGN